MLGSPGLCGFTLSLVHDGIFFFRQISNVFFTLLYVMTTAQSRHYLTETTAGDWASRSDSENPRLENALILNFTALGAAFKDWKVDNVSPLDQRSPEASVSPQTSASALSSPQGLVILVGTRVQELRGLRRWVNQQLCGFISKKAACQAGLSALVDRSDRFWCAAEQPVHPLQPL